MVAKELRTDEIMHRWGERILVTGSTAFWAAGLFGHMRNAARYLPPAIRKWISAIWIQ